MHTRIPAAAALAALFGASSGADVPFSFDDIHYWVGEGTNRAAVVIDWNRGEGSSLVWGYRWNGNPVPAQTAIVAIAHEDRRLAYGWSTSQWGTSVDAFGYDRSDVAAEFNLTTGQSTDTNALVAVYAGPFYWAQSHGTGTDFASVVWAYGSGVDYDLLSDGAWYALKRTNWQNNESSAPVETPIPAESPYGWRIVDAFLQEKEDQSYWWDGVYYSNIVRRDPAASLGHPSLHVSAYGATPDRPVTPAESAWNDDQIVKLVAPDESDDEAVGWIAVEFDHPVLDDPRNPFGLDVIVFSYRFVNVSGGYFSTDDPSGAAPATDAMYAPRGLVEVSQDGEKWLVAGLIGTNAFAPTLSHVYDPDSADPSLFPGNLWWGAPADATRPFDPDVVLADLQGLSLARMCSLYDGSAGGTGFDIGNLDLAANAEGRKWIRFVRVSATEPGDEISVDAIADVSPAPSFRNWVDKHVAFADRPGYAKTTVCANGLPAYVNAALGLAPDTPSDGAFAVTSFAVEDGAPVLRAPLAPYAYDLVRLRWSDSLETPAAQWQTAQPLWHAEGANQSHAEGAESAEFSSGVSSQASVLSRPAQARPAPALHVPAAAAPDGAAFYRIELHD